MYIYGDFRIDGVSYLFVKLVLKNLLLLVQLEAYQGVESFLSRYIAR